MVGLFTNAFGYKRKTYGHIDGQKTKNKKQNLGG
jgi:hypothetical protein